MRSSRPFRFLSEPRRALARAMAKWARRRQGDDVTPFVLQSRRIYILPTRTGLVAAGLLFLMLLAGLNYNNSLALMLCFLLCGVTLISMHQCHRMLSGLIVAKLEVDDTYAQTLGELRLFVENGDRRTRTALMLGSTPCPAVRLDLGPLAQQVVRIAYQAGARGRQRLERLELATTAPLSLFRAWTWLHLPAHALIYPAPKGDRPLPPPAGEPRGTARFARSLGEEEWAWLRPFQESDPPRSVAWKAYARGGPLLVAHYDAPAGTQRLLELSGLRALGLEAALSQLAQWVLECERIGESYGLELGSSSLPIQHGAAQRRACLEALARYDISP